MKLRFCVICGTNKNLHHHHVIPKVSGGTDHQHNLITLCDNHHEMVHRIRHVDNWFELARIGREKAKNAGVKFGRKRGYTPQQEEEVMNLKGMLKENSLKGKTILVTGGATGLGKSMAKYFLELGANIVIASRKQEVLDKTSKELMDKHGGKVLGLSCDVRKYNEVEETLEKIIG